MRFSLKKDNKKGVLVAPIFINSGCYKVNMAKTTMGVNPEIKRIAKVIGEREKRTMTMSIQIALEEYAKNHEISIEKKN